METFLVGNCHGIISWTEMSLQEQKTGGGEVRLLSSPGTHKGKVCMKNHMLCITAQAIHRPSICAWTVTPELSRVEITISSTLILLSEPATWEYSCMNHPLWDNVDEPFRTKKSMDWGRQLGKTKYRDGDGDWRKGQAWPLRIKFTSMNSKQFWNKDFRFFHLNWTKAS